MSNKSEAKINMEKSILEAVHWMGIESLSPCNLEKLEDVIHILIDTRNLTPTKHPIEEQLK